jgi:hypothetical protein
MESNQNSPSVEGSAAVPVPQGSGPGTVLGVFFKPRQTFERLRENPRILLALVILVIAQIVFSVVVFRSGAVANDAIAKLEAQGKSPQEIERVETFFSSPAAPVIGAVSGAVVVVFVLLVSAGLMFFMGNLMLGARLTFKHYLCVAVAGGLIGLIGQAVRSGLALSKGTMDVRLGVGNLLGDELGYVGRVLDTVTDPLILWSVAITALGVSVFARKGFGFGVLAVLPGFVLSILLAGMR